MERDTLFSLSFAEPKGSRRLGLTKDMLLRGWMVNGTEVRKQFDV
jgi:hypothetical protein